MKLLLGFDAMSALGGVEIDREGRMSLLKNDAGAMASVDQSSREVDIADKDFSAVFRDCAWTVAWKGKKFDQI